MAYLSYKKLGLKKPEHRAALIKTLKHLESGKVKYATVRGGDFGLTPDKESKINKFNMETYIFECGTPACVAGWADHFLHKSGERRFFRSSHDTVDRYGKYVLPEHLNYLFSGFFGVKPIGQIKPKAAAKALRRFLETGTIPK